MSNLGTLIQSNEDNRASELLRSSTVRKTNHFETGLLWKFDDIKLPNSFPMARKRLMCLEKKMTQNAQLEISLKQMIRDYITKGYARKLCSHELTLTFPRIWYLPMFSVTNPKKPNKVRLVWDAAAKVKDVSLNSVLLKGPDQLSPLPGVLARFRQRKVALCADIAEMFHQVRIRETDQHSQRFLWRETVDKEPDVYVMQVMTFGASCSPSSAQYVKNLNAKEFTKTHPRAVEAIVDNHYVDDLLDSLDTVEEASQLAKDVIYIHSRAGFKIHNFISNSPEVLDAIGEQRVDSKKNLDISTEPVKEKVLGMWWCTATDSFTYSLLYNKLDVDILAGRRRPTKREV